VRPEPCVGPRQQIPHHVLVNCSLLQEHPQHLVSEEPRHRLRVWGPLDWDEGAVPSEQTPRDQEMHMGMPIEEAPSALHAGDSSGDRRARPGWGLEEVPDRLVGQAGQPGQPFPAAKERPQPPRERDDHVAVGDRFKDLLGD